jgi:hypothetical protein
MSQQRKFEAEILVHDPDDVPTATRVLAEHGFHFTVNPDMIDECGPTVFGSVSCVTGLSEDELYSQLRDIVGPVGDVAEWGFVDLQGDQT